MLRLIGYWRSDEDPEWPDPREFVDVNWEESERQQVSWYFSNGLMAWVGCGFSTCRFCGKPNGSAEFTDGTYVWPQGLAHYLDEHGVRLPAELVQHALTRLASLDDVEVDRTWWRETRPDWPR